MSGHDLAKSCGGDELELSAIDDKGGDGIVQRIDLFRQKRGGFGVQPATQLKL